MPLPPVSATNPANWTGFTASALVNNLFRWGNYTTDLYTSDFTTVDPYRGYMLYLRSPVGSVSYEALAPTTNTVEIALIGGWNWIGVPLDMSQTAISVRNNQTMAVRTVTQDAAQGANAWLNYNWTFLDSAARTPRICSFGSGADDNMLRRWFGYRVFVTTLAPGQTYTLIVPAR